MFSMPYFQLILYKYFHCLLPPLCAESQQFMQTRCREQIEQTCRERDQAVLDVQSLERAFSDLHRRFDKSKQIIANAEKVLYLWCFFFLL